MENVRNRMKMQLVSDEKKCAKLINRNTFKDITIYNNKLAAIHLNMDVLQFDKPIYVGFSILDLSKTLIYDFHYNSMVENYGSNIQLMYTDTGAYHIYFFFYNYLLIKYNFFSDSLIYYIKTVNFYTDLINKPNLLNRMDTSNLSPNHPCYCVDRKKLPGTFTDETKGQAIREFVALRAKSYAYNLAGEEKLKAKGVRRHVVKNHMTIEDYKQCLFWDGSMARNARELAINQFNAFKCTGQKSLTNQYTPYRVNISLRSFKHQMKSISTVKLALNRSDDKRLVLENQINTRAHGHYRNE
jgi:hypothetical protein